MARLGQSSTLRCCRDIFARKLLYLCPHTTAYESSHYYMHRYAACLHYCDATHPDLAHWRNSIAIHFATFPARCTHTKPYTLNYFNFSHSPRLALALSFARAFETHAHRPEGRMRARREVARKALLQTKRKRILDRNSSSLRTVFISGGAHVPRGRGRARVTCGDALGR